jgi:hypothetical protein
MHTKLGLPHLLTFATLHLWPTFRLHGDSPFLLRSWWGKDASYNVIWDAFVSITKDVGFHGAREQTHILLLLTI